MQSQDERSAYQHLLPNQPDNTIRLTPAQERKKEKEKAKISSQLKVQYLRETLIDLAATFAVDPDVFWPQCKFAGEEDEPDIAGEAEQSKRPPIESCPGLRLVLNCLNPQRLSEIEEERLSLEKCANVFCRKKLSKSVLQREQSRTFLGTGSTTSKSTAVFCSGSLAKHSVKTTPCVEATLKLREDVAKLNEGGPFGTSIRVLSDFLSSMIVHPKLHPMDKINIERALQNYRELLAADKLQGSEPKQRVIDPKQGNPSDKKFVEAKKIQPIPEEEPEEAPKKKPALVSEKTTVPQTKVTEQEESAPEKPAEKQEVKVVEKQEGKTQIKVVANRRLPPPAAPASTSFRIDDIPKEGLDYIDSLFEEDEIASRAEEEKKKEAATATEAPKPVAPSGGPSASIQHLLDKPVQKKKVKFEEKASTKEEDSELSGKDKFEKLVSEKKESAGSESDHEEEAQGETLAGTQSEAAYDDEEEYGEFFPSESPKDVQQMLEEVRAKQSPFQKMIHLFTSISNYVFKKVVNGKHVEKHVLQSSIAVDSQVHAFFERQVMVHMMKVAEFKKAVEEGEKSSEHPSDTFFKDQLVEVLRNSLKPLVRYLTIVKFTWTPTPEEWLSIGRVFLKAVSQNLRSREDGALSESEQQLVAIGETVPLSSHEALYYEALAVEF